MKNLGGQFFTHVGTKEFMNSLIVILTDPDTVDMLKSKILQLIQQWGVRFEDDRNFPLFNEVYQALQKKLGGFPDEGPVRQKLGKPSSTPSRPQQRQPQVQHSDKNYHQQPPNQEMPKSSKIKRNPNKKKKKEKKEKEKPKVVKQRKEIKLNSTQQALKKEIDTIVESIDLTNSMIDNADAKEGLDLLLELVGQLRNSESQLIEAISNNDQADLIDYAIKVNDDRQATIQRFRQLQKGQKPAKFKATHKNNNFNSPPEEEIKLEMSEDTGSEDMSTSR